VGALRAYGGKPPVGIKLVIEGQEEVGSPLNTYPPLDPERFRSDAMVIADMGSVRPGVPTLTVALRGTAVVTIEVRTLAGPKHSGQYGGAAPDALLTIVRAIASLHDDKGNVTVPGLRRDAWKGASYTEDEFRELAELQPGMPFIGTGSLGERLWSGPAITITGLDVLSVEQAVNAVVPYARAKINLRVHPAQDAEEAQRALIAFLEGIRPFGISLDVKPGATGNGFAATSSGPAYDAARKALAAAWGGETVSVATGGSIPLVNALQLAVPDAEILLLGATDGFSNIHAPNERVLLDEFRKTVLAEALFFEEYAARWSTAAGGGRTA
jgi:acetylornithine deacetylase/succinyl-diaminopimelate desuccinylase-like protein